MVKALRNFLADGTRLSVRNAECCEEQITMEEVIEVRSTAPRKKSRVTMVYTMSFTIAQATAGLCLRPMTAECEHSQKL